MFPNTMLGWRFLAFPPGAFVAPDPGNWKSGRVTHNGAAAAGMATTVKMAGAREVINCFSDVDTVCAIIRSGS